MPHQTTHNLTPEKRTAYFQIHIAIFLWGFTAILGRWISLSEVPLVWYRVLITCIALLFLPGVLRGLKTFGKKNLAVFAGIGCLIALHWVFFYGAIKYSNVSVALSGLATTSLFTSLLEPLIFKKRIRWVEVLLGLLVIVGIYVIFNATPSNYHKGFIMSLIAAFFAATFSILNKKYIDNGDPKAITVVEMASGFVLLSIAMPFYLQLFPEASLSPTNSDWVYLLIMSLLCTALTMVLALKALKHITAFASNLSLNLEPVYGILLAWVIFDENKELSPNFYIGAIIIILSVFMHPLLESPAFKKKMRIALRR